MFDLFKAACFKHFDLNLATTELVCARLSFTTPPYSAKKGAPLKFDLLRTAQKEGETYVRVGIFVFLPKHKAYVN